MSACDTCRVPGHCCTRLHLSGGVFDKTYWVDDPAALGDVQRTLDSAGLPFKPLAFDPENLFFNVQGFYGYFLFTCPQLLPNGRCGIYHARPQVCRDYAPKADGLCIEFEEASLPPLPLLVWQATQF